LHTCEHVSPPLYRCTERSGTMRLGPRHWRGEERGCGQDCLADCHDPTLSGMSSWTFYLLQENNEKLSVPVQFTLFLNFIVVAPSLSLAPPVPGLTTAQDDGWLDGVA